MRTTTRRRWLLACLAALLIPLAAFGSSACGSPAKAEASTTAQQTVASPPVTLDVTGTLLLVRRQDAAWKLVRLTPATGAEQMIGALPFRPWWALAAPGGKRVLYWNGGRGRAVVDAATGSVQRVSLAGLPIRSIDGATWTSENRFLFGGSRRTYPSPQFSSLYRADVRTGKVTSFRRLPGGEPSYAADEGSLIYVTRRRVGDTAKEAIWRLRSLTARRPVLLTGDSAYIDAGRSFNTPLLSPDGAYVLSAQTGTDISVTYSLINVAAHGMTMWQLNGASPMTAAWGGAQVAFQQSLPSSPGGKLALFVYDAGVCSLSPHPTMFFGPLDWSNDGDLVGGSWDDGGVVYAASASDLETWVNLGAGLVPVWVHT